MALNRQTKRHNSTVLEVFCPGREGKDIPIQPDILRVLLTGYSSIA